MSLLGMFREPRLVLPKLTRLANLEASFDLCTLQVPGVCVGYRRGEMVWCHSNLDWHGKGKGLKSHDCFGAVGCPACHRWLDAERHKGRQEIFLKGHARTFYIIFRDGLLKVAS